LANVSCSTGLRAVPSLSAIRSASSRFDVPEKTRGSRRCSNDRRRRCMSEADDLVAVECGERTLLAAGTAGEIVGEAEAHEPCLQVAEIEVGCSCE